MLLGAQQVRIPDVLGTDLGEHFTTRGDSLSLEGFDRRSREHLGRHQAFEQLFQRNYVDRGETTSAIDGYFQGSAVGSVLESVKIVPDAVLDAADDDGVGVDRLSRQSLFADRHEISVSVEQLERAAGLAFDVLGGGGRNPEFALERVLSPGHLLGLELLIEDEQI